MADSILMPEKRELVLELRAENNEDREAISKVIMLAFENNPVSDKREAEIVNLMRQDSALTISIVAEMDKLVVGHISFSEVTVNDEFIGWYGLAPVSVSPQYQNKGIGSKLVNEGLAQLKQLGADGCVLLGDPNFYKRFGFANYPEVVLEGVPPEYFQALVFRGEAASGTVKYHAAFG